MTVPLDTALEVLDEYRDLLLKTKRGLQDKIAANEAEVKEINVELASVSAGMNLLDARNGTPVTKEEIYGEKEDS